jgi:hypothetical protein
VTAHCQSCDAAWAALRRAEREHATKLANRERLIAERNAERDRANAAEADLAHLRTFEAAVRDAFYATERCEDIDDALDALDAARKAGS